jgi:transcriptional regulator with XRE-family HTH domain
MPQTSRHGFAKVRQGIAIRIRELRTARGWTQAELAKRLHFSQNRLSEIERGRAREIDRQWPAAPQKVSLIATAIALCCGTLGCSEDAQRDSCPDKGSCLFDANGDDAAIHCNPLTHSGCLFSEKCSWIVETFESNRIGHGGCVPAGNVTAGEECAMVIASGGGEYDNCERGAACRQAGESCRLVCDPSGGDVSCLTEEQCATYDDFFASPTTAATAGLCVPSPP